MKSSFNYRPCFRVELEFAGDDHIYRASKGSFYELDLLRYIEGLGLPRRGLAIDVGANIGNHTVHFGLGVSSEVLALEPDPNLFEILQRNVQRNGVNATCLPYAVGAFADRAHLVPGPAENSGMGKIRLARGGAISVVTIDDMLDRLGDPDVTLIKVDVEGMELDVLYGAEELLERPSLQPHLFLEAKDDEAFGRLAGFLVPLGYRSMAKHGHTPVWHFAPERWWSK